MRNTYAQMCDYRSRFRILKGGKISLVVSALIAGATLLQAAPSGGVVTAGNASIAQNGSVTTINQSSQKASINWTAFSIAPSETVNFKQPNASSITLNRVVGNEKSIIEGALNANGQVFILNSNGVLFSKNASINTAGLVATTMNLSDADFMNGNYAFKGGSTASIINEGVINISDKGYAALFGKEVKNEGVIKATLGKVELVGAKEVTLNLNGNSLVNLKVDKGVLDALVENKGAVYADGGEVYLTTNAVNELLRGVVNNRGIIEANSMDDITGKIELFAHGGTTNVEGTLEAKEGFVETSGDVLHVKTGTTIKAKEWLLDPTTITIQNGGGTDIAASTMDADTLTTVLNTGTNVTLSATSDITVDEAIIWSDATQLKLTSANTIHVNDIIKNTNTTNGGVYFNAANTTNKVIFGTNGLVSIYNPYQLQWVNRALLGKYALGGNIDASGTSLWNSGAGFVPIGDGSNQFSGSFDGLGHTIDGLTINRPSMDCVGLFGNVDGATLQNIGLTSATITGRNIVGGLVGYHSSSTISNSYTTGSVRGISFVGGFVGFSNGSSIDNSYAAVSVSGTNDVGGLVGYQFSSSITHSYWDIVISGQSSSRGGSGLGSNNAFTQASYAGFDFTNTWYMIDGKTRPFLRNEYSTTITNDHQLQLMAMDLTAHYTLAKNITYTGTMWSSAGFAPIGNSTNQFSGTFDGLGHTIDGLTINRPSTNNYVGLFGYTHGATINDIGLVNASISSRVPSGHNYVGGLVAYMDGGSLSNVYVLGNVEASIMGGGTYHAYAGGLVGYANGGSITNAYSTGSVNATASSGEMYTGLNGGNAYAGGLVGLMSNGTMTSVYANTTLTGHGGSGGNRYAMGGMPGDVGGKGGDAYVGGLVGYLSNSTIANAYAIGGTIFGASGRGGNGSDGGTMTVGGFTHNYPGGNGGNGGSTYTGGLVGYMSNGSISNAYATKRTTSNVGSGGSGGYEGGGSSTRASSGSAGSAFSGGVVGENSGGTFNGIFWDKEASSQTNGVGSGSSLGVVGKTTAEMQTYSTYNDAGWNIIGVDGTYPTLTLGIGGNAAYTWQMGTFLNYTLSNIASGYTYTGTDVSLSSLWSASSIFGSSYASWALGTDYVFKDNSGNVVTSYTNAGTYSGLYVDVLKSGYTEATSGNTTGSLTINKANATVTANSDTKTYNGLSQSVIGYSVSGLVNGENASVLDSITGASASGTNAGTYTTNLSGSDNNYNLSFVNGTLTIPKANITLSTSNVTKTYDGTTSATGSTIVTSGRLYGSDSLSGGAFAYSDPNAGTGKSVTVSGVSINDGNGGNNYNVSYANNTNSSITKANATVTANSDTKSYNGLIQSITGYTVSGLVNGENASVLDNVNISGSGKDVGSYVVTGTASDNNYNLSVVDGTLRIKEAKKDVALTPIELDVTHIENGTATRSPVLTTVNALAIDVERAPVALSSGTFVPFKVVNGGVRLPYGLDTDYAITPN